MGGGGGEVQYSCKGKLNEKSPCNPKKLLWTGLPREQTHAALAFPPLWISRLHYLLPQGSRLQ